MLYVPDMSYVILYLAVFAGIDVTYDVHTNGDHQTGGFRSGGRHFGGGRGAGCCGKSGGGTGVGAWAFCPAWENMEKRCATENKKAEAASQPTESSQMETDAPKSPAPNASVSQDVPMGEEKKKVGSLTFGVFVYPIIWKFHTHQIFTTRKIISYLSNITCSEDLIGHTDLDPYFPQMFENLPEISTETLKL